MQERKYVTDEQAKELAKTEGIEILYICPHCRFYVTWAGLDGDTKEPIVMLETDCIYKESNEDQEQYEEMMGVKFPVRPYCPMEERKCYVMKREELEEINEKTG